MKDLIAYEQYTAKYDAILKDPGAFKCSSQRRSWERDCEVLANSLVSVGNRSECGKRALTLEDLLVKVCFNSGLSKENQN